MIRTSRIRLGLLAAASAVLTWAGAAGAAPAIPHPQSVVPLGAGVQVLGKADPQAVVKFQIALPLRDGAGLSDGNRRGRILTPDQLEQRHLPSVQDYNKVLSWLNRHGLTVDATTRDRLTIEASGNAASVSRLLGVHFSHIRSEGLDYVSADTAPKIPAELSGAVLSVNGLQPHLHFRPMHVIKPMSATAPPLYPIAFLTAYSAQGIGNGGSGATTAIAIDTLPNTSDLTAYWTKVGVAQSLSNITLIQAVSGHLARPSGEETLDAETASSIAPNSKVRVYASKTLSFANLDTTYQRIISDMQGGVPITQVSISLGACETAVSAGEKNTEDNFFAVMSSLGASVFVSTGDSGSKECGSTGGNVPSFPATSPNATAVGGTSLTLNANGTTNTETGWSGSGGGISQFFATPGWQSGLGFAKRSVPDLASDADPNTGELVILNGRNYQYGGTSLSAPMWAGFAALVNSSRIAAGKPKLGLLNARIYGLAASNWRDITAGNNGGYSAGPGYDLVTGIGTPVMSNLLPTLVAQP